MSCKSLRTLTLLKEKQVSNYILLDKCKAIVDVMFII